MKNTLIIVMHLTLLNSIAIAKSFKVVCERDWISKPQKVDRYGNGNKETLEFHEMLELKLIPTKGQQTMGLVYSFKFGKDGSFSQLVLNRDLNCSISKNHRALFRCLQKIPFRHATGESGEAEGSLRIIEKENFLGKIPKVYHKGQAHVVWKITSAPVFSPKPKAISSVLKAHDDLTKMFMDTPWKGKLASFSAISEEALMLVSEDFKGQKTLDFYFLEQECQLNPKI